MPKRSIGLSEANARLHKNHSFELLVATWLMNAGWQVFAPLLDAAHAVDLIVSDGPNSYRVQIKTIESQDEHHQVQNAWKNKHIDFVIYFAQRSNWGYVCPAFDSNQKRLDDPGHKRFEQNAKSFLAAFHTCEKIKADIKKPLIPKS
jgi:Holliday junction resolvase-like predicted endonuclease